MGKHEAPAPTNKRSSGSPKHAASAPTKGGFRLNIQELKLPKLPKLSFPKFSEKSYDDEDELIEDGLYFIFLDKDVDDLDKLYDKANAIVRAAHKFILAIG